MMNLRFKKEKGFTLIEMLVSVSVLMIAMLGPLTIASRGISTSIFARDQITAYYLAQEGIEFVRYVRDNNRIETINGNPTSWLEGLENCPINGSGQDQLCKIDMYQFFSGSSGIVTSCGSTCPIMRVTPAGYYTYVSSGNPQSRFTRTIKLESIPGVSTSKAVRVRSTVSWQTGFTSKTFDITEDIFNQ